MMGHSFPCPRHLKCLEWNPTSADIRAFYANHLRSAGRLQEAQEQFKKSLDLYWTYAAAKGLQGLVKASEPPAPTQ